MAIYYPAGAFTDEPLSKPVFGWWHYTGTPAASSSQAGFPASAAYNELTYERWRPTTIPAAWQLDLGSAKICNYCAIAAHTLANHLIYVQRSPNGLDPWTTVHSFTPTDNSPIIVMFADVSSQHWRVLVQTGAIPSIGVVYFGGMERMPNRIEVGISPISLSRRTIYSGNTSEGGNWLGRSIKRTGKVGQIPLKAIPRDWYISNLDPMIQAMRYQPFFFASCPKAMPWDVSYCWLTDDPKPLTVGGMLMDVTLNVEAHAHE